jgi:hypothetical protein
MEEALIVAEVTFTTGTALKEKYVVRIAACAFSAVT